MQGPTYLHKKNCLNITFYNNWIASDQDLVVSESIGFIIPLAYLASLYVVYHGPNAENLGKAAKSFNKMFLPRKCEE